ncbi:NAD(P)-dependent oxidoreductase [Desertihabitans aurantiacus]|uniref:NAD(P)-dependent oxidoreductase n=1 Tax=Desertihabitans aurantiacus TaxID=2282477 RepID=UPI000DF81BE3|nr:NAD(P)-binding domain-containing protein [Desertihabitans aurantiacus]
MANAEQSVVLLGLGAMGHALAAALVANGREAAVWNRTPGRAGNLVARGAIEAATPRAAVAHGGPVVVCLFDHASVHQTLDPLSAELSGRSVINLTTTTPDDARELAAWAAQHGIAYLDGAIMATPPMIGGPGAQILYSGSRAVYDQHRDVLDLWATSVYDGEDAGLASLFDLAILSGMYPLFTGFLHGAAMVQAAGITATEFAERATPFLAAMTQSFASTAQVVDARDYSRPFQSLDWTTTALDTISRASSEQGVDPVPVVMVKSLVEREIEDGHGKEDFNRIIERMRSSKGGTVAE